jgi:hypothetical protein
MTRILTIVAAAAVLALAGGTYTYAQDTTCKVQAGEKKLAGAAQKSFMTKCQKDATASCNKKAADQKLKGAAKTSFTKKCVTDAVGS